uniref:Uncharacterized protein n=1 Tax=Spongospora subterranea TaxID=70186 RepID=A0A0H5QWS8_9EUKA|eukprot:CRZ06369.1 hypothetical protein [Spongospora subterranea]
MTRPDTISALMADIQRIRDAEREVRRHRALLESQMLKLEPGFDDRLLSNNIESIDCHSLKCRLMQYENESVETNRIKKWLCESFEQEFNLLSTYKQVRLDEIKSNVDYSSLEKAESELQRKLAASREDLSHVRELQSTVAMQVKNEVRNGEETESRCRTLRQFLDQGKCLQRQQMRMQACHRQLAALEKRITACANSELRNMDLPRTTGGQPAIQANSQVRSAKCVSFDEKTTFSTTHDLSNRSVKRPFASVSAEMLPISRQVALSADDDCVLFFE